MFSQQEHCGFITEQKFDEACQRLAQLAIGTNLPDSRVEIRRDEGHRYLIISRPLQLDHLRQPSARLAISGSGEETPDISVDRSNVEDEDVAAVHHSSASQASSSVRYHILYSISYQVPVLYFFLHGLPTLKARNVDTVYHALVPQHLQDEAKAVGVMGGIGMTNHPINGIPCFWVHPCNTAEAMKDMLKGIEREVSPAEYLMIWFGKVGASVGLSLPIEMISGTNAGGSKTYDLGEPRDEI
ncbi:hypothetical protein N7G274_001539 [Stereocaulon virgatum]|uniref:Ubiquitin-like-conjugating enzyme ATG10 n=1 Tax=Stereocaulon virgatum TaxID=373712 RepID=A0ABR4AJY7_9LECA